MTDETQADLHCPRDQAVMQAMGRRPGAWRCPDCHGVFLHTATMRKGAAGRPPAWSPMLMSVVMSVLMTMIVRRLRRRAAAHGRGAGPAA